jgi:hypothetical protein
MFRVFYSTLPQREAFTVRDCTVAASELSVDLSWFPVLDYRKLKGH